MLQRLYDLTILIRGAGEMASGTACRLHHSGFFKILMTEIEHPIAVRRMVSLCEALHHDSWSVEGVRAVRVSSVNDAEGLWNDRAIPLLVDEENRAKHILKPDIAIDAILAKKNLGTTIDDAPLVIGMGPGFSAGTNVHCVVETNRGHDLGRLISEGEASPNTGVPGDIAGRTAQRVLRSPSDGVFESNLEIGALVDEGEVIGHVGGEEVRAGLKGVLRGLIRPGTSVDKNLKIGDVDPRGKRAYCYTISEKARAIGGSVLEAILAQFNVEPEADLK
jgi:xanthine dehydrogenase accessory factor